MKQLSMRQKSLWLQLWFKYNSEIKSGKIDILHCIKAKVQYSKGDLLNYAVGNYFV